MNIRIYKENEDPNLSIQNCRQNRWGIDDRTQQMTYNFFWIRSRQSLMMGDRRVRILWIHSSCDVLACDLGSPLSLSLSLSPSSQIQSWHYSIWQSWNQARKTTQSPIAGEPNCHSLGSRRRSQSPISVGTDLITGRVPVIEMECSPNARGTWRGKEWRLPTPYPARGSRSRRHTHKGLTILAESGSVLLRYGLNSERCCRINRESKWASGMTSYFSTRGYHKTGTSCKDIIVLTAFRVLLWAVYTRISMTIFFLILEETFICRFLLETTG